MSKFLEAALAHAEAGFYIIPVLPDRKAPPLVSDKADSNDPSQIKEWWTRWPNANIGCYMKRNGLIGADVDIRDEEKLKAFLQTLPPTVMQRTPSTGASVFFKNPGDRIVGGKKAISDVLTLRNDGLYFLLAPSYFVPTEKERQAGKREGAYTWIGRGLHDGELAELPDWMVDCQEWKAHKTIGDPVNYQQKIVINTRHDDWVNRITRLRHSFPSWGANELFKEMRRYANLNFQKPEEKTDDELNKLIEWAMKTVQPQNKELLSNEEVAEIELAQKRAEFEKFILLFIEGDRIDYLPIKNQETKEVELITNQIVVKQIIDKNYSLPRAKDASFVNSQQLNGDFNFYLNRTIPLKEAPKPFAFLSDDSWCFKKLGFDPTPGPHPAWDSFTSRLSDPEAFKAFVWSIFEYRCFSRQFCYLYGPSGNEGKSTVVNVLSACFGVAAHALDGVSVKNTEANRWLTGQLVGKRFLSWGDCLQPWFCSSEILRNVTSGDYVNCERKNHSPFRAKIYVRTMIASNLPPAIGEEGADYSRLLRIDVASLPEEEFYPDFETALTSELSSFLWECKEAYTELCPDHRVIRVNAKTKELVEESSATESSQYEHILETLEFGPGLKTKACDMNSLCCEFKLNTLEIGRFKTFLDRKKGVKLKRMGHGSPKFYVGCRIIPNSMRQVFGVD